ncbi:MAG TPA: UDP-N-acetylmuramoyl-tripeptide--D-alanyl-D-alanine ligase [Dissulfurispiraceae bacterium]|nr:UDP-N-acetylmuramoyl-tripeptide--D-alanyl-D-alanine ligase [Dissulfurispiraceae bacterium]
MLRLGDVLAATGGQLVSRGADEFSGVSTDSRTIKKSELFIPLKGNRFDGHDFVKKSLKTCAGVFVDRSWTGNADHGAMKTVIKVDDTLLALQALARYVRNRFRGPVIAVVGSNGKTTTKELISSVLGTSLRVLKTEGNLNNHIGMPLCITRADDDTGAMVLEMGTNRPGDVDLLCRIASPDIGVITNIGAEHLEGFGSMEAVRDAELEILPYLKKVVLNGDDAFLIGGVSLKFAGPMVTFGISEKENDITADEIAATGYGCSFLLHTPVGKVPIHSRLSGRFNIYNSLAACAAAHSLGIGLDKIREGLEAFGGVKMRFEIKRVGGVTYLYDVYNANPSSMKASIEELARIAGTRRSGSRAIAVLGDMLELGDYGVGAHREIGEMLLALGIDRFIGVGPLMKEGVSTFGGNACAVETPDEAGEQLASQVADGDVVLIKGSRGMKMERVMEVIEKRMGKGDMPNAKGRG